MNTNKKRNRIILCICSILVLFASVFAFIPLNKETKVVKADTVTNSYSFSGSNISSKTTFTNGIFSANLFDKDDFVVNISNTYGYFNLDSSFSSYTLSISDNDISVDISEIYIGFTSNGVNYNGLVPIWLVSNGFLVHTNFSIDYSDYKYISFYPNNESTIDKLTKRFNFMLNGGEVVLPYQPYQDSTQLNFDFSLLSNYLSSNGAPYIRVTSNIDGGSYAYVYPNDDVIYNSDKSLYNVFIDVAPNPNSNTHYIHSFRFLKYDSASDVLDPNYEFYLYTSFDYLSEPTGNYFESNISYLVLGSYLDYQSYFNYTYQNEQYTGFNINTSKYNFISYVDFNNRNWNIFIPLDSTNDYDYWDFRTYYLSSLNDSTSEQVYNSGYNKGYNTGYQDGEVTGQQNGYNKGYNSGKNDGYNLGYNTALDNEKYSFTNLISAVIDVPVKAFTSLFNFEILGVNLSGFFLGLLTCCIVIGVVRLIL